MAARADAPPPGAAPIAGDFVLKATDGRNLRLSEYRGDPLVLVFWGSWCGPCRESLSTLDQLARRDGTQVLGVSLDGTAARAGSVASALGLSFPSLVDDRQRVARAYDVDKLPLTLLIDRHGAVRASWAGEPVPPAALAASIATLAHD